MNDLEFIAGMLVRMNSIPGIDVSFDEPGFVATITDPDALNAWVNEQLNAWVEQERDPYGRALINYVAPRL
jgi:hypothetical protein